MCPPAHALPHVLCCEDEQGIIRAQQNVPPPANPPLPYHIGVLPMVHQPQSKASMESVRVSLRDRLISSGRLWAILTGDVFTLFAMLDGMDLDADTLFWLVGLLHEHMNNLKLCSRLLLDVLGPDIAAAFGYCSKDQIKALRHAYDTHKSWDFLRLLLRAQNRDRARRFLCALPDACNNCKARMVARQAREKQREATWEQATPQRLKGHLCRVHGEPLASASAASSHPSASLAHRPSDQPSAHAASAQSASVPAGSPAAEPASVPAGPPAAASAPPAGAHVAAGAPPALLRKMHVSIAATVCDGRAEVNRWSQVPEDLVRSFIAAAAAATRANLECCGLCCLLSLTLTSSQAFFAGARRPGSCW